LIRAARMLSESIGVVLIGSPLNKRILEKIPHALRNRWLGNVIHEIQTGHLVVWLAEPLQDL